MENITPSKETPQKFEIPGHNGSPSEPYLGRTLNSQDFESTTITWSGLEDICLDNIISATLNQDVLRKNFEILMNGFKTQNFNLVKIAKQQGALDEGLAENKALNYRNENKIGDLYEKNIEIYKQIEILKTIEEKNNLNQQNSCNCQEDINFLKLKWKEFEDLNARIRNMEEKNNILEEKNKINEEKLEKHDNKLHEHELRLDEIHSKLNENIEKINNINNQVNKLDSKFEGFEAKIHLIESLKGNGSESNGDFTEIINQIAYLQGNFKNYARLEDLDDLKKLISNVNISIEKDVKNLEQLKTNFTDFKTVIPSRIEDINKYLPTLNQRIENLEDLIENMKKDETEEKVISKPIESKPIERRSSVTKEMFNALSDKITEKINEKADSEAIIKLDKEIEIINEKIETLLNKNYTHKDNSPTIPPISGISTKDSLMLKEMYQKMGDFETLLRKIQREISDNASNLSHFTKETNLKLIKLDDDKLDKNDQKLIEKLEELTKKNATYDSEIHFMKDKLGINEKLIGSHDISINDIFKEIAKFKKRKSSDNIGLSKDQILLILEEILGKYKNDINKIIDDLKILLDKKVELPDLYNSESKYLKKLEEIINLLLKKFCDKNETKKAFLYIENKINQLFEAVFGEKENDEENDALFAKKNLWSCASCDKEIDKFQGKLGDYKNWAQFPPKNTSPERMGKFGTGYTRMIEDRKDQVQKDFEKLKKFEAKSITNYKMFPEIKKNEDKISNYHKFNN